MNDSQADGCVVHGKHLVYHATFTIGVCKEITAIAEEILNLSYNVSSLALEGTQQEGNSDSMQKDEPAVYTANYGASDRPQNSTASSSNPSTIAINDAIGAPRGGNVVCPAMEHSISSVVGEIYHADFYPFFRKDNLPIPDQWYGQRVNRKRVRNPRFPVTSKLQNRKKMKVFYPMKSSLPPVDDILSVAGAEAECRIRTLSEWILSHVFFVLPYGSTGALAARQTLTACKMASKMASKISKKGANLPCVSLCRMLPKGAIGTQRVKELHDDGNAGVIPGIWTSVLGDESVVLRFMGRGMNSCFRASDRRFCWFYGWIPHKTEVFDDSAVTCRGQMGTIQRIHHSAFSKLDIEHIGLVLFSPKHVKDVVKSYSFTW
jgi:hypothetical protein